MIGRIVDTRTLEATEEIREQGSVDAIAEAMVDFEELGDWDEMPAIIISSDGRVIDGHHRVAASLQCGLNQWRALEVDWIHFKSLEDRDSFVAACKTICDDFGDDVTWGSL